MASCCRLAPRTENWGGPPATKNHTAESGEKKRRKLLHLQRNKKTMFVGHECCGGGQLAELVKDLTADQQAWKPFSATKKKKKKCLPAHVSGIVLCTSVPDLQVLVGVDYNLKPTILLFTSSSMALTSSAALGVSELLGRADRRDAD